MLARDSHSQKRIEQAMERSVPLVADIAFLLKPSPESPVVAKIAEWVVRQRQTTGGPVIGTAISIHNR